MSVKCVGLSFIHFSVYFTHSKFSMLTNFCYAVLHKTRQTGLLENISFVRDCFLFHFLSSHSLISERGFTESVQWNQQLALSRLTRGIHCGNALFLYKTPERRRAQQTLTEYTGLHNIKDSKVPNVHFPCRLHDINVGTLSFTRQCVIPRRQGQNSSQPKNLNTSKR